MIDVAPSAISTSSVVTAAGAPTPGLTSATSWPRWSITQIGWSPCSNGTWYVGVSPAVRARDDVAEPAHHGTIGEPERRTVDPRVDHRHRRRIELEQRALGHRHSMAPPEAPGGLDDSREWSMRASDQPLHVSIRRQTDEGELRVGRILRPAVA